MELKQSDIKTYTLPDGSEMADAFGFAFAEEKLRHENEKRRITRAYRRAYWALRLYALVYLVFLAYWLSR